MSEKKKSRKQLRKEQKEALEKAQRENSLKTDFDAENILKKNQSSLQDLLAPSGIDCTHFDYLSYTFRTYICLW